MLRNNMPMIHPGEILADELEALDNMSASKFAQLLAVPTNRITNILNGNRAITADTALRLSKFFGTTPQFWLNLQDAYDLKKAQQDVGAQIEKEVCFVGKPKKIPLMFRWVRVTGLNITYLRINC